MTREEAIEVVKERLDYYEREKRLKKACEILIPELAESEDERIRKHLIEIVEIYWGTTNEPGKAAVLAYLEKQKEPVVNKEGMYYYLGGKFIYCGYSAIEGNPYDFAMNQQEKQKEQKPCWNPTEEDVALFNKAITTNTSLSPQERAKLDILRMKFKHCPVIEQKEQKPVEWDEDIIQKAVKEVGLTQYQIDWFKTNVFQPKREWSDEDEAAWSDLMWCIEQARKSAKDENDMGNIWFAENWVKNRLKSLRPQPKQEQNDYITPHKKFFKFIYDRLINVYKENPSVDYMRSFKERLDNLSFEEKQEWNEEDEDMRDKIISDLEWERRNTTVDKDIRHYDEELHWLKSLKPQSHSEWRHYIWAINMRFDFTALIKYDNTDDYEIVQAGNRPKQEKNGIYILIKDIKHQFHWKPSKEQMEALERTIHLANFGLEVDRKKALESLYEQIKKL